ncbi:MAG: hypothetical protein HKN42_06750 [Granulosicoccus sp.]|nr:hypothetical protein [Granulosicoccus sp.]
MTAANKPISEMQVERYWTRRRSPAVDQAFSEHSRQRIVNIFTRFSTHDEDEVTSGLADSLDRLSVEIAGLADADGVGTSGLFCELRSCQLSMIELMLPGDHGTGTVEPELTDHERLSMVSCMMSQTDALIDRIASQLSGSGQQAAKSGDGPSAGRKTLQHEIRTPLQGALLTSELVLEDLDHGEPVALEDIRSIRQSLETAVKVLNEFAGRTG